MNFHDLNIPELMEAIEADSRITSVAVYVDGWADANAYHPAPGTCMRWWLQEGEWQHKETLYDRKHDSARGSHWVLSDEKGSTLVSR